MSLEKNRIYRGYIEGYSSEGLGIARIDGQVVFVHQAIRGETCDILIMKVLKNTAFGKIASIIKTSDHRIVPDCPWFGKCGGCNFRHMDYEEELSAKKQRVQDALSRLGGSSVRVETILGAPDCSRYRNKSIYPISTTGTIGLYRARTHDVQKVETCLLQKEEADKIAKSVQSYIEHYKVPCYDEKKHAGLLRYLYVRTNQKGECLVCLIANGKKLPHEKELVETIRATAPTIGVELCENTHPGNAILSDKYRLLWGEDTLTDELCGLRFQLSVPSFYQVNREQAQVLYQTAAEMAGLNKNEIALDLYCGAGTITQVLSQYCKKVIGAEIVPEAIENAKKSSSANGVQNAEFYCGDARDIARRFAEAGMEPDVICVDPPRKGLSPDVITSMIQMNPNRIVYVSCDPATLGRDVRIFEDSGYYAEKAIAVDLFPRTAHVETVVCLSNKNSKPKDYVEIGVDAEDYYKIKDSKKE